MEHNLSYVAGLDGSMMTGLDGTPTVQNTFSRRSRSFFQDERPIEEMVNDGDIYAEDIYADAHKRLRNPLFYNTKF